MVGLEEEQAMPINSFSGAFGFLSNFYPCQVLYEGLFYPSAEHAYQAGKTLVHQERIGVKNAKTPGKAKRMGRKLELRDDWEEVKLSVMDMVVRSKFRPDSGLADKLVETYPNELVEGNNWGDTFWGVCKEGGENHLGRILEEVRKVLMEERGLKVSPRYDALIQASRMAGVELKGFGEAVEAVYGRKNPAKERSYNDIDRVLGVLGRVWKGCPSLRLGQLLKNASNGVDLFYLEDEDLEAELLLLNDNLGLVSDIVSRCKACNNDTRMMLTWDGLTSCPVCGVSA